MKNLLCLIVLIAFIGCTPPRHTLIYTDTSGVRVLVDKDTRARWSKPVEEGLSYKLKECRTWWGTRLTDPTGILDNIWRNLSIRVWTFATKEDAIAKGVKNAGELTTINNANIVWLLNEDGGPRIGNLTCHEIGHGVLYFQNFHHDFMRLIEYQY